jgi:hypothetical protein
LHRAGEELGYKVGDINAELQDGGFTLSDTTTTAGNILLRLEISMLNYKLEDSLCLIPTPVYDIQYNMGNNSPHKILFL